MSSGASLEAALKLHSQGINVLRAAPKHKRPAASWKRWQTERQTKQGVEEEFSGTRGDDNIFAVTGSVSKLVVLDCDDEAALRYWRGLLGVAMDRTASVRTGKGRHFWFSLEAGQRVQSRKSDGSDGTGKWDLQAEGKGVVAPPSIHPSGSRYEWARGPENIQPAPAALLGGPPETSPRPNGGLNGGTTAQTPEWEPLDLEAVFRGVPAGGRDDAMWKFACSLRGRDVPLDEAAAQVEEAWSRIEQPLGDEYALATALEKLERAYRDLPAGRSPEFEAGAIDKADDGKPSVATLLVRLAQETHSFVTSEEGEAFAVPLEGPRVAQPLRGNQSFRRTLAARYFQQNEKAATSSALADALGVLEGWAYAADRERVNVRIARTEDGVALDLGDATGRSVAVDGDGWQVVEQRGPHFRRTALTSAMDTPTPGGSLDPMRDLLNIADESWDLLVGYMVAAWIPEVPHPVLWLTGEQGTGKTSALRMIASLLDPSPAQTRTPPRDIQEWVVTLSGSWVVPVDNISKIPDWLSDAMCRAATGDGLARRQLYGDNDLVVNQLRNVVLLNGIGVGGFRGDLGDRLVPIELERIPPEERRPEIEIRDAWEAMRPGLIGALLDALSATLRVLPDVRLGSMPRMADFARVLAAVDTVRGTDALGTYLGSREAISEQVIEADAVASGVRQLADDAAQATTDGGAAWTGTATDLLAALEAVTDRDHRGRDWPKNAQALSSRLQRVAPDLSKSGVEVERSKSKKNGRLWTIRRTGQGGAQ